MTEIAQQPQLGVPKRVITYILQDFVPRKSPEYPVVHVSSTSSSVDTLPRGRSAVARQVVDVLAVGTDRAFHRYSIDLRQSKARTRKFLSDLGYTVYTGGPRRVYVIEFDSSWKTADSDMWLYVGETGQSVEHRVQQHLSGEKAARGWRGLGRRRPDLEPEVEYWSVEDSIQAEKAWAMLLSAQGYKIRGPEGFNYRSGSPSDTRV